LAGFLIGIALTLALGAADAPRPAFPRYSVQYAGRLMLITDNEASKLYVYVNNGKSSVLEQTCDLTQTGKDELLAETMPAAKEH
jgi:hypothetical protein